MHMIANFWPGATLEQFQLEGGLMIVSLWEGQAQYDSWAEATLLPQIDLPGCMEGRPEQRKGLVVDHYSVLPAS